MDKLDITIFSDKDDTIENTKFCSGVYFHGKLEDDLGYDLVSESSEGLFNAYLNDMKENTTKTVSLKVLMNKEEKIAHAYLWKTKDNRNRGLICYPNDYKYVKDAKQKQALLKEFL